jgi:hypothetical protein
MPESAGSTSRSVKVHAGVAEGIGVANDATVETGTPLAVGLLAIAEEAVVRSNRANPGSNDELHACLVAVLCAHAALEARMNEAAEGLGEWWDDRERQPVELKWADLVERLTGARPLRRSAVRAAVARLTVDRNRIAHFRGVPMPDGRVRVSGPPDKRRGGITQVRGYFDTTRAAGRLEDAKKAMEALRPRL